MEHSAINFNEKFSKFFDRCAPKIIARMNDYYFYEKSGYRCYGDTFLDAGIIHRHMEKNL